MVFLTISRDEIEPVALDSGWEGGLGSRTSLHVSMPPVALVLAVRAFILLPLAGRVAVENLAPCTKA